MNQSNESFRILIIDDDDIDRTAIRRALIKSEVSCVFTEAQDYDSAMAVLEIDHFDCTFLDYRLPDQDGLALLKAARKLNIHHPIVVLTGQGDEQIAVELMKAGATDYLAKSQISPDILAQILRNAIRMNRAEQEIFQANQQLKQNNEQLRQQNYDLEQQRAQIEIQNLQRADFISHLTHDLRTPLVAANMMFELFKNEAFCPLSPEMHEAITALSRSNQSLLDLVNTLLEVNCYESGTKRLTFTTCVVWDLIHEVVQELAALAQSKSIALIVQSDRPHPESLKVHGDRLELRRMITNLIGNSLKFTDQGQVVLRLGFRPVTVDEKPVDEKPDDEMSEMEGWVSIEVEDTGLGMSSAEQQEIFKRFHTGSHQQSGSGLGLHLVHRIITEHSGTISVTSELGQGSLFTVNLPAMPFHTETNID